MLFVLPALMALSSCSAIGHTDAQSKDVLFKEEADACVELFGDNEDAIEIKRMTPLRSAAGDMVEPRVGVQYRAKYQNDGDPAWYVAVRFIAEIKTLNVNVTWTRSVYQANGTILGSETSTPTTKAYTSLNSNSEDITPSSGYNYFVAYTLKDIPFESFDNCSIVAYVTLTDTISPAVQAPVTSQAMIARIGGGATAAFDVNKDDGYFIYGKIGGEENITLNEDNPTKGSNRASFCFDDLRVNDAFVIVNKDTEHSKFQIWGSSCLTYDGNETISSNFENLDGKIKVKTAGNYILYLNSSDPAQLWRFKYNEYAGFYVRGAASGAWDNPSDTYQFVKAPEHEDYHAYLLGASLSTGEFLIGNYDNYSDKWGYWGYKRNWFDDYSYPGYGVKNIKGTAKDKFGEGGGSDVKNISCNTAGTYDIYLGDDGYITIDNHVDS